MDGGLHAPLGLVSGLMCVKPVSKVPTHSRNYCWSSLALRVQVPNNHILNPKCVL